MATQDELAQRFTAFARESAARAPLYATLAAAAAEDPTTLALLQTAPEMQQMPVLLFAAVHHLLLAGDDGDAALARHYLSLRRNVSPTLPDPAEAADAASDFRAFVRTHGDALRALLATRSTQTNEVGRCALFLPAFGLLHAECGPLAHVDVGASAGLTLLLPRYSYRYEPGGLVTPTSGPAALELPCGIRGAAPIPSSMPAIDRSIGLDLAPIDVTDDDAVRWLEACVWPDQTDRFERLVSAVEIARANPPDVRRGDAVRDVAALVEEASQSGHPVVTTSWVLSYLTAAQRTEFVARLDDVAADIDLSWVIAEAPALTPELPVPAGPDAEQRTVLSLVRWRDGIRTVERLAVAHPHGYWLHWEH